MVLTREKVTSDLKFVDDYSATPPLEGCSLRSFEYLTLTPIATLLFDRLYSYAIGCARDYGKRIEISTDMLSPNLKVPNDADISIVLFEVGFPLEADKRTIDSLMEGAEVIRENFYVLERRVDRGNWEELV